MKLSRTCLRHPLGYALLYVVLSLGVEAVCMIVFRLRPPRDNAILAPVVLIAPPLLAPWLAGWRGGRLAAMAAVTGLLTLFITVTVTHFTKISTGMVEPLLLRGLSGWLAGWGIGRMVFGRRDKAKEQEMAKIQKDLSEKTLAALTQRGMGAYAEIFSQDTSTLEGRLAMIEIMHKLREAGKAEAAKAALTVKPSAAGGGDSKDDKDLHDPKD